MLKRSHFLMSHPFSKRSGETTVHLFSFYRQGGLWPHPFVFLNLCRDWGENIQDWRILPLPGKTGGKTVGTGKWVRAFTLWNGKPTIMLKFPNVLNETQIFTQSMSHFHGTYCPKFPWNLLPRNSAWNHNTTFSDQILFSPIFSTSWTGTWACAQTRPPWPILKGKEGRAIRKKYIRAKWGSYRGGQWAQGSTCHHLLLKAAISSYLKNGPALVNCLTQTLQTRVYRHYWANTAKFYVLFLHFL